MATSAFKSTSRRSSIAPGDGGSVTQPAAGGAHRRSRSLSRYSGRFPPPPPESDEFVTPRGKFVNKTRGSGFPEISLDNLADEFFGTKGFEVEEEEESRSGSVRTGRSGRRGDDQRFRMETESSSRRGRSVSKKGSFGNGDGSWQQRRSVSVARRRSDDLETFDCRVPTIGGKPLDLHRLFVEVTCRGGLQKVIGDRKWRDIRAAFTFPSTTTNASFVLRKNYISLLQTYEQVYFFRKGDLKVPPNAHPPLRVGSLVKGKINGKFENGYLVMANFGSEILNGVLYPVPNQPLESQNLPPRKCGWKRPRKETDPSSLNSDMGGYNIFYAEQYSKLRQVFSGMEKVIVKHINSLWNKLTEPEKEVYQERDRERCKTATS